MVKIHDYEGSTSREVDQLLSCSEDNEKSRVYAATRLARWFSLDLVISIFGHPIIEWHYPPQDERSSK